VLALPCCVAVGEDGELPPELAKHEPRLIEAVCNEVRPLMLQDHLISGTVCCCTAAFCLVCVWQNPARDIQGLVLVVGPLLSGQNLPLLWADSRVLLNPGHTNSIPPLRRACSVLHMLKVQLSLSGHTSSMASCVSSTVGGVLVPGFV